MKKVLLVAAVMLCGWTLAKAEMRDVPRGPSQALATADYGGVNYSTAIFPFSGTGIHTSTIVIPTGGTGDFISGVFYGVMFSSGQIGAYDFVSVFDSTSANQALAGTEIVRLYNVNNSTGAIVGSNSASSGFSGPPKPIRFAKGLMMRLSNAGYNMVTALYSLDD